MSETESSSDDEPPIPPPNAIAPPPPVGGGPPPPRVVIAPPPPKEKDLPPPVPTDAPPLPPSESESDYSDYELDDTDDEDAPPPPTAGALLPPSPPTRPKSPSSALRLFNEATVEDNLSDDSDDEKLPPVPPSSKVPPPPKKNTNVPSLKVPDHRGSKVEVHTPTHGTRMVKQSVSSLARKYESKDGKAPKIIKVAGTSAKDKGSPKALNRVSSLGIDRRLTPSSHRPSGYYKKKIQCAAPKCMSFTVRETTMCLRHMYLRFYKLPNENLSKQYQVAVEICTTEETYLKGLRTCKDIFLRRLQIYAELEKPIIPLSDVCVIFNNLEAIYSLSKKLYDDLEIIRKKKEIFVYQIGLTLLHYAPYFRPYQEYLEGYDHAVNRMIECRKQNPDFDFFCRVQEKAEGVSLESLLIMPVQRLPRYLLLLRELKKQTKGDVNSSATHEFENPESLRRDLEEATDNISRIAAAINKSLSEREKTDLIREIADMFDKDNRYRDLVKPGRVLIKDGILSKAFSKGSKHMGKYKKYHFFLFNDVVIYADEIFSKLGQKRYKMKHSLDLDQFIVLKNTKKQNNRIEVIVKKKCGAKSNDQSRDFLLKAQNTKDRDEWYIAIDTALKQRAMQKPLKQENFDGRRDSQKGSSSKMAALLGM